MGLFSFLILLTHQETRKCLKEFLLLVINLEMQMLILWCTRSYWDTIDIVSNIDGWPYTWIALNFAIFLIIVLFISPKMTEYYGIKLTAFSAFVISVILPAGFFFGHEVYIDKEGLYIDI